MTAYITAGFNPKDKEKLQRYGASVPATLVPYGGEYVAKGKLEALTGEERFRMQVILAFPSAEKAVAWYNSPEYQSLIPLRDEAMTNQFQLIRG